MKTKWYVDTEADRYSIAHFEHCLKDGMPRVRDSRFKKDRPCRGQWLLSQVGISLPR